MAETVTAPAPLSPPPAAARERGGAGAFPTARARRRYWVLLAVLALASGGFAAFSSDKSGN